MKTTTTTSSMTMSMSMSMSTRRRRRRVKRRRDDETPNHGGDEPRAASVVAVDAAETASS
jgi:hypothetical protein